MFQCAWKRVKDFRDVELIFSLGNAKASGLLNPFIETASLLSFRFLQKLWGKDPINYSVELAAM